MKFEVITKGYPKIEQANKTTQNDDPTTINRRE